MTDARVTLARWLAAEYLWLEREMRQVLAELELTSNGVTSAPRLTVAAIAPRAGERVPSSTASFESAPPVTGDANPPHVHFRWKWTQATTNDERRKVIEEARAKLHLLRVAPPPGEGESPDARNRRMLADYVDFPAAAVAIRMRMSEWDVRKARVADGRDAEWGRPTIEYVLPPNATVEQRRTHVRHLHDEHRLSERMIAKMLDVSHVTIWRDLRATDQSSGAAA